MSIEKIHKALLEEARTEADRIVRLARLRAEQGLEKARREIHEEFERRENELRARLDAERELYLVNLRTEQRQEILARKNKILNTIYERLAKRLDDMPRDDYRALMARWLANVDPGVSGEVAVNLRDRALLEEGLLEEVNRSRDESSQLRLADEPIDVRGGFVFRCDRFELDRTLDSLLMRLKEETALELAAEIFGRAEGKQRA